MRLRVSVPISLALLCLSSVATAQLFTLDQNARIQKRANAALTLMSFSVTPDASAASLSITEGGTDNPGLTMGQLGAGFTVDPSFPVYLEGFLGYSRYDPKFVASNGVEQRSIPVKWNTLSGTAGLGWDFPLFWDIKFRPIFNFSLGHVESDVSLVARGLKFLLDPEGEHEFAFLDRGRLNSYGLGGSAMLDYEHYREAYEIDVELRYTYLHLQTFDSSAAVSGYADAQTLGLWSRLRLPTGLVVFRRPLRYVFEYTNTIYLGDQRGALGFNYLNQFGLGLELDTSAYHLVWTRTRFVARYVVGDGVSGVSGGIAVTFF
jgi:hypothetical protein